MKRVKFADVCAEAGVERTRIVEWRRKGIFQPAHQDPGHGVATLLTFGEAFVLAVAARLSELGVPPAVAVAAARAARLSSEGVPAFLVVSTGSIAPKLAKLYAADAPAEADDDPEANVPAMTDADGAVRGSARNPGPFAYVSIAGPDLLDRLADPRRRASTVVALDPIERTIKDLFEREGIEG